MTVVLRMEPEVLPITWAEFCWRSNSFSIALDGYVADGPKFDFDGPRVNFNHHEGVSRLETRATCGQVLMAIRQGLFKCFCDQHGPRAEVYANDCDEDVCAAWFVLNNVHLTQSTANLNVNRLVGMVDALDSTAGAYPFQPDLPALQELAWIFQPYRRFRRDGGLDARRANDFVGIVTDVESRMIQYVAGHGKKTPLDFRFDIIGGGKGWSMIHEIGEHGRTGAFNAGVEAYVIARERADGRMAYTVGRISQFIPFNVPRILFALNKAEGSLLERWGGGDTIGGSSRAGGSKLTPDEVARIINEVNK